MKIQNCINYLKYIFKFNVSHVISLSINFGILSFAIYNFFTDLLTNRISIILFVLPLLDIIWQCYGYFSDFKSFFFKKYQISGNEIDIDYSRMLTNGDWQIEKTPVGVVAYDNTISYEIRNNSFNSTIDEKALKKVESYIKLNFDALLPFLYIHYKDVIRDGKKFTNDKKLCLAGKVAKGENVRLYKGCYYNTYLTNKIFTTKLFSDEAPDIYPPYGCQNNCLRLPYEYFSNEIGVSTLAITADGYLFFQRQGSHADSSTGLIVPSGSGSADWGDYQDGCNLNEIITFATNRELSEEIGYTGKKANRITIKSKIIGMFRWMNFGAKPEFVSLSLISILLNEIEPQKSEQKSHILDDDIFKILNPDGTINDTVLAKCWQVMCSKQCSVPLYMNLKFLKQYITDERDDFYSFINSGLNQQI